MQNGISITHREIKMDIPTLVEIKKRQLQSLGYKIVEVVKTQEFITLDYLAQPDGIILSETIVYPKVTK